MSVNALNTDILELIFQNTACPDIGDAAGLQPSATAGSFYIGLHTDAVGDSDTQDTNEATYTGYSRVAVARNDTAWTVSGNNVSNASVITFGECTAGSETITHVSIGLESTGATKVFRSFALSSSLAVSSGVQPAFAAGDLDVDISDTAA